MNLQPTTQKFSFQNQVKEFSFKAYMLSMQGKENQFQDKKINPSKGIQPKIFHNMNMAIVSYCHHLFLSLFLFSLFFFLRWHGLTLNKYRVQNKSPDIYSRHFTSRLYCRDKERDRFELWTFKTVNVLSDIAEDNLVSVYICIDTFPLSRKVWVDIYSKPKLVS